MISLERQVRIAAGALVLVGLALGQWVHPWGIALSGFVGAGLVFAGWTDTCGMGMLLAKAPWNRRALRQSSTPPTYEPRPCSPPECPSGPYPWSGRWWWSRSGDSAAGLPGWSHPPESAIPMNLLIIALASLTGIWLGRRQRGLHRRAVFLIGGMGAIGAPLGASLTHRLTEPILS